MNYEKPTHLVVWRAPSSIAFCSRPFSGLKEAENWLDQRADEGDYAIVSVIAGDLVGTYRVETRRTVTQMA